MKPAPGAENTGKGPSRVLVTGAGGFLGSHICHHFEKRGCKVAALGRFLFSSSSFLFRPTRWKIYGMTLPDPAFEDALNEFKPDLVVHAAGTASVANSVKEPYQDFRGSVDVCAFTLEMIRKHAPGCAFAFLSSASVYGNPASLPIREDFPRQPISPYGFHKCMCELLVEEYGRLHGVPSFVLRIFSAYGESLQKQVVYDLSRKMRDPAIETVSVYGTGNETRDFIHASDVAAAIDAIVMSGQGGIFNVASGVQTSIAELTAMLAEALECKKQIVFSGQSRSGDPQQWQADISRLTAAGFKPAVELKDGIRKYCKWLAESGL